MNILHYALGFPPYRSGGLTKMCVDLMAQQAKEGHQVAMLWPGQIGYIKTHVFVRKCGYVDLKNQRVQSFEIVNPLPVPYDEGIINIDAYTIDVGKKIYNFFLDNLNPDVIHIHTLMGLHKSFLEIAKSKGIRLVFTTHDFFPICPKVTMFRNERMCNHVQDCTKCGICNATALSLEKIRILQSPIYRYLKNITIIRKLRKRHRDRFLCDSTAEKLLQPMGTAEAYKKLRNYYYSLLKLMDVIHYNSTVTKKVYESVFDLPNNCLISLTHADIKDKRRKKTFSDKKIRIRYLGPQGGAKGFFFSRRHLMSYGVIRIIFV
jgi:hypothetical protein